MQLFMHILLAFLSYINIAGPVIIDNNTENEKLFYSILRVIYKWFCINMATPNSTTIREEK